MSSEAVNIRILDREYTIGVAADERDELIAAARMLDAKMREIRNANRMASVDRVAVLAALNLAHDLHQLRQEHEARDHEISHALRELNRKLDLLGAD
ncbi:MAG: cell division protein ZapA [Lysobacter sp.]|nr:cell division protein ZapA [Lysobacter sp.]